MSRVAVPAPRGVPAPEVLEEMVGDARVVLIGESSHGTHEFYRARAEITRWLIEHKGFTAVAAEADWPDAHRVNRFVRWRGEDRSADEALGGFERFPAWMWRNDVVRDFVVWLRQHNSGRAPTEQAGFYGLDLYSLHRSMQSVVEYLDTVDPVAAARARHRYACFDHTAGDDGQAYGYAAAFGASESCEREAVTQLVELQRNRLAFLHRDGALAEDELFSAVQNAATVCDAEAYYRTMFHGRVDSWNVRDTHMAETLEALQRHLDEQRGDDGTSRIVVWAHNSHVGDARASEVGTDGEHTLGQLVRERLGRGCRLIGFTTHHGTVTAASDWGGPSERKAVRAGLPGSLEELLHEVGEPAFLIRLDQGHSPEVTEVLNGVRLHRAIGVIYRPETERHSHYFHVRPADQYDALIHIDATAALTPLEPTSLWYEGQTPETYPSGL